MHIVMMNLLVRVTEKYLIDISPILTSNVIYLFIYLFIINMYFFIFLFLKLFSDVSCTVSACTENEVRRYGKI